MARTNKYNCLNFNEIYEKKFTNNSNGNDNSNRSAKQHNTLLSSATKTSSSSTSNVNKTMIANSRIHGHMLVLTRPTPKPISVAPKLPPQDEHVSEEKRQQARLSSAPPDQNRSEPGSISLRPQGRTGPRQGVISSSLPSPGGPASPLSSPLKTDKFVPPHLRPGFMGREEKPGPGPGGMVVANREFGAHRQGQFRSSPNRFGEDGRPKSGGGYERMRRGGGGGGGFVGGEAEPVQFMNPPGSSGARPSSSG